VYGYLHFFGSRSLLIFLLATAAASALLTVPTAVAARYEWSLIFAWLILGLALQALLRSLTPFTFERIFTSDGANSFYTVARERRGRSFDHPLLSRAVSLRAGQTLLLSAPQYVYPGRRACVRVPVDPMAQNRPRRRCRALRRRPVRPCFLRA